MGPSSPNIHFVWVVLLCFFLSWMSAPQWDHWKFQSGWQKLIFANPIDTLMVPLWSWDPKKTKHKRSTHPKWILGELGPILLKIWNIFIFLELKTIWIFKEWALAHHNIHFYWVCVLCFLCPIGSQLHRGTIKSLNWVGENWFFGISVMWTLTQKLKCVLECNPQKWQ